MVLKQTATKPGLSIAIADITFSIGINNFNSKSVFIYFSND